MNESNFIFNEKKAKFAFFGFCFKVFLQVQIPFSEPQWTAKERMSFGPKIGFGSICMRNKFSGRIIVSDDIN